MQQGKKKLGTWSKMFSEASKKAVKTKHEFFPVLVKFRSKVK